MASYPIYQFDSQLRACTPKIWRRFQAAGNITMAQLGYIVMTLYEMRAQHPFCLDVPMQENLTLYAKTQAQDHTVPVFAEQCWRFTMDPAEPAPLDAGQDSIKHFDASTQKMKAVLFGCPGERLSLTYDYGDNWEVLLTLEAVLIDKDLPGRMLPRVLEGEGYGIIEDCGGPDGLAQLAKTLQETQNAGAAGRVPDLGAFDPDDMNYRLKKIPRIYRGLYEYNYELTQRTIALLEREYLT